jgi:uncharacterized integral membrane protein
MAMRIIALILLLVGAVVFAVQNAGMVSLQLLAWRLDASLAVIIVLCVAIGSLLTLLSLGPSIYRHRNSENRLRSRVAELEREHSAVTPAEAYPVPAKEPPRAVAP